jgi:hypothetical protein
MRAGTRTKTIGCACLIYAALLLVFFSRSAESAGVVLRLDSFDKLCKVEISKGPVDDSAQNKIVFTGTVERAGPMKATMRITYATAVRAIRGIAGRYELTIIACDGPWTDRSAFLCNKSLKL